MAAPISVLAFSWLYHSRETNACIYKGLFTIDSVWMWIEFAFTWCASIANWIVFILPKFWNQIVTKLLLVCHTHCSNDFYLGLSSQHFRCIETHTEVHPITSFTLSLVVEDVECELRQTTWDHLVRKRSLFWQHLDSTVPAWQVIVVCILDSKYYVYGGLETKASTMLLFVS